jgi:endo-1,4-beta-xylanase
VGAAKAPRARPILGTAIRESALNSDVVYTNTIRARYKSVTPEEGLTWRVIQPSRGVFNFSRMDKVVNFAIANGKRVEGLALLWYKGNPAWLLNGTFTRDEAIEILQTHIRTILERYRGKVAVWHIANEAINPQGEIDQNVFYKKIGPDYLDIAFRTAREADPTAKLYYNDAGNEQAGGGKATGVIRLVRGFRERGVPIDGVGMQMHTTILSGKKGGPVKIGALFHKPSGKLVRGMMLTYAGMGLEVAITEMDVRLTLPSNATMLRKQKSVYNVVYKACIKVQECKALTTWGVTDKYSWVGAWTAGKQGDALPFDYWMNPKPAASVFFR